jgi:hypothetical protein
MGRRAHPLLLRLETSPPLYDHVSSEESLVKIDRGINSIHIKSTQGVGGLVTYRQTEALLDFALAFK